MPKKQKPTDDPLSLLFPKLLLEKPEEKEANVHSQNLVRQWFQERWPQRGDQPDWSQFGYMAPVRLLEWCFCHPSFPEDWVWRVGHSKTKGPDSVWMMFHSSTGPSPLKPALPVVMELLEHALPLLLAHPNVSKNVHFDQFIEDVRCVDDYMLEPWEEHAHLKQRQALLFDRAELVCDMFRHYHPRLQTRQPAVRPTWTWTPNPRGLMFVPLFEKKWE